MNSAFAHFRSIPLYRINVAIIITVEAIIRAVMAMNQYVLRFRTIISRHIRGSADRILNLTNTSILKRYDWVLNPVRYAVEVAI